MTNKEVTNKIVMEAFHNLIRVCIYDNADTIDMTIHTPLWCKSEMSF